MHVTLIYSNWITVNNIIVQLDCRLFYTFSPVISYTVNKKFRHFEKIGFSIGCFRNQSSQNVNFLLTLYMKWIESTESIKSFDILRRLKSSWVCSNSLCSNLLECFDFSDRWTPAGELHPLESEGSGLQQSRRPPEPCCRTRCVWTQQALAASCKPDSGFIRGFYKFYIYAPHANLTRSYHAFLCVVFQSN